MKVVITYDAFRYDGSQESIGALIAFVNSPWDLKLSAKEKKVKGSWHVSFEYPNNEERVEVEPGQILYKGAYGAYSALDPDLTKYRGLEVVEE